MAHTTYDEYQPPVHTGLIDKNGIPIKEGCFLECDDGYYKTRNVHYVFWDKSWLQWSTIKFFQENPKLNTKVELSRVQHLNPIVIERPKWIHGNTKFDFT